jgi:phage protein U
MEKRMNAVDEITITIPVTQAAQRHIEHLQDVLSKRNAEIDRLLKRVEEAETGEPNQLALGKAYRRGWQEAANHLMSTTQTAARALGAVRKDAFDIYLQGEKAAANGTTP